MIERLALRANVLDPLFVRRHVDTREVLSIEECRKRRLVGELATEFAPFDHEPKIGGLGEVARIDSWRGVRILVVERDLAAALHVDQGGGDGDAIGLGRSEPMGDEIRRREMKLDIGNRSVTKRHETTRFTDVRTQESRLLRDVLEKGFDLFGVSQRDPLSHRIRHTTRGMVDQVLSDVRRVVHDVDSQCLEVFSRSDPRQHQQLR